MQKRFEVISVERNDNVTTVMCNSVVKMFGGFLSNQKVEIEIVINLDELSNVLRRSIQR
jgi:hypothetical protein